MLVDIECVSITDKASNADLELQYFLPMTTACWEQEIQDSHQHSGLSGWYMLHTVLYACICHTLYRNIRKKKCWIGMETVPLLLQISVEMCFLLETAHPAGDYAYVRDNSASHNYTCKQTFLSVRQISQIPMWFHENNSLRTIPHGTVLGVLTDNNPHAQTNMVAQKFYLAEETLVIRWSHRTLYRNVPWVVGSRSPRMPVKEDWSSQLVQGFLLLSEEGRWPPCLAVGEHHAAHSTDKKQTNKQNNWRFQRFIRQEFCPCIVIFKFSFMQGAHGSGKREEKTVSLLLLKLNIVVMCKHCPESD